MYSILEINKQIPNEAVGWFGEDRDVRNLAIENGMVTHEQIMDLQEEWDTFVDRMRMKWPESEVKRYMSERRDRIVKDMRLQYSQLTKRVTDLELENKESRTRGVSFKDRQAITDRIKKTLDYRDGLKDKADAVKRIELPTYDVMSLISRDDMAVVLEVGLERFLDVNFPTELLLDLTVKKK